MLGLFIAFVTILSEIVFLLFFIGADTKPIPKPPRMPDEESFPAFKDAAQGGRLLTTKREAVLSKLGGRVP